MSAPATIDSHHLSVRLGSAAPPRVLDVRTPGEFETTHIAEAYNVPLDLLREHRDEIVKHLDDDVVLVCRSGRRAVLAEETLRNVGLTGEQPHLTFQIPALGASVDWETFGRPGGDPALEDVHVRAQGQLAGVISMIEQGRDCKGPQDQVILHVLTEFGFQRRLHVDFGKHTETLVRQRFTGSFDRILE